MTTTPGAAVVPYRGRSGKVVQFAADGVAADVRIDARDRRRRTSAYPIRLASTEADTWGRLVGVLACGDVVDLGAVAVSRGSIGVASCTVTSPPGGYRAVYLEIRSDQVLLQVEAPKPPRPRRLDPLATVGALIAGCGVAVGAVAFALALPQTPTLQAPDAAIAGRPVSVAYATRGYGSAEYVARYDDGVVFASGQLAQQNGRIALTLPGETANRRVFVALSLHGPVGSASAVTSFTVNPPPPRVAQIPARVLSFAARRDPSPAGETVLASYLAVADTGTIVLQDRRGRVIASAPFSHVGTNRLAVGSAYRSQPLTARITVDHGKTRAVASIALPPGTQAVSAAPAGAKRNAAAPRRSTTRR